MRGRSTYKMLLLFAGIFLCTASFAQYNGQEDLEKAVSLYNEYVKNKSEMSRLDSAKSYITRAFKDEGISKSAPANLYFGAILKEVYKAYEAQDAKSESRKMSVDYFLRAMQLDTSTRNKDVIRQQLKWIAGQFNNDAKRALERGADVMNAAESFKEFKRLMVIAEPSFDVKAKELEFELASGSALQDKADKTGKKEFFDLAKVSYLKVLDMDSTNNDANYNLGIIYYNQGANLIMNMSLDTPLDSVSDIENRAKAYFLQAKPFMHKVERRVPNCLKILEGLMGIYYSLYEDEMFRIYKERYDKLKADIEAGRVKEEC